MGPILIYAFAKHVLCNASKKVFKERFYNIFLSFTTWCYPFKHQPHKMVKKAQTICRQQPTNCLSVFDPFVGLVFKGLSYFRPILFMFLDVDSSFLTNWFSVEYSFLILLTLFMPKFLMNRFLECYWICFPFIFQI